MPSTWAPNDWVSTDAITHTALNNIGNSIRTWGYGSTAGTVTVNANANTLSGLGTLNTIVANVSSQLNVTSSGTGTSACSQIITNTASGAAVAAGILRVVSANADPTNALLNCVNNSASVFAVYSDGAVKAGGRFVARANSVGVFTSNCVTLTNGSSVVINTLLDGGWIGHLVVVADTTWLARYQINGSANTCSILENPSATYTNTDSGTGIAIYPSSGGTYTMKNRSGSTRTISMALTGFA
jgi:hypothetical protein